MYVCMYILPIYRPLCFERLHTLSDCCLSHVPPHLLQGALALCNLGVGFLDYCPLPASSICVSSVELLPVLSLLLFLFSSSCYLSVHLVYSWVGVERSIRSDHHKERVGVGDVRICLFLMDLLERGSTLLIGEKPSQEVSYDIPR